MPVEPDQPKASLEIGDHTFDTRPEVSEAFIPTTTLE